MCEVYEFIIWHTICGGPVIIIIRIILALLACLWCSSSYSPEHLKIAKWAFAPMGKKLIYSKRQHIPPNHPDCFKCISAIFWIPIFIAVVLIQIVFSIIAHIIGNCLTGGRMGKYWDSIWRIGEMKYYINVVDEEYIDPNSIIPGKYRPNIKCKISLKGYHNKYLCAETNGNMVCNREHCKEWEQFESIPLEDNNNNNNNKIALRSNHGKYLSVNSNGELKGDRNDINECEEFIVEHKNGKYGFKSYDGKYLSAQSDGRIEINRDVLLGWELFDVTVISQEPVRCIDDGYYFVYPVCSNKVLSQSNNKYMVQNEFNGGDTQQFWFNYESDSNYSIRCKNNGKYWDIEGASNKNGAKLILYDKHLRKNQLFTLNECANNEYCIIPVHCGKVIDISGARKDNNVNVIQWDWHSGPNQRFRLEKVSKNDNNNNNAVTLTVGDHDGPVNTVNATYNPSAPEIKEELPTYIDVHDGDVAPPAYNTNEASPDFNEALPGYQGPGEHEGGGVVNQDGVAKWLRSIGDIYYTDYYQLFIQNGFDSLDVVKTLTDNDLNVVIGVEKLGHRRKLQMAIEKL